MSTLSLNKGSGITFLNLQTFPVRSRQIYVEAAPTPQHWQPPRDATCCTREKIDDKIPRINKSMCYIRFFINRQLIY